MIKWHMRKSCKIHHIRMQFYFILVIRSNVTTFCEYKPVHLLFMCIFIDKQISTLITLEIKIQTCLFRYFLYCERSVWLLKI